MRVMGEAPADEVLAEIFISRISNVKEGKISQQRRAVVALFNDKIVQPILAGPSVRVPVFERLVEVVGGDEAPSAREVFGREWYFTVSSGHVEEELPVRVPPAAPLLDRCRYKSSHGMVA